MSKLEDLRAKVEAKRKEARSKYETAVKTAVEEVLNSDSMTITLLNHGVTDPSKQDAKVKEVLENITDKVITNITDVEKLFVDECHRRNFCKADIEAAINFICNNCSGKSITSADDYKVKLEFAASYVSSNPAVWDEFDCLAPIG